MCCEKEKDWVGEGVVRYLVTELSAKIAVYVVHTACNFVRGKW